MSDIYKESIEKTVRALLKGKYPIMKDDVDMVISMVKWTVRAIDNRYDIPDAPTYVPPCDDPDAPSRDEGEWVKWNSQHDGEVPFLPSSTIVQVEFRNGVKVLGKVGAFGWDRHGSFSDIIAYRVLK